MAEHMGMPYTQIPVSSPVIKIDNPNDGVKKSAENKKEKKKKSNN